MRGFLMSGTLGAMLVGSLVSSVDAAETSVCAKSKKTLTITVPASVSAVELDKSAAGEVIVRIDDARASCADASGHAFEERHFHSIEMGQDGQSAPTTWLLAETRWQPTVTLHNDAADTIELAGTPGADVWQTVAGSPPSLSLQCVVRDCRGCRRRRPDCGRLDVDDVDLRRRR